MSRGISIRNINELKGCWERGDQACKIRIQEGITNAEKHYSKLHLMDLIVSDSYKSSGYWFADLIENGQGSSWQGALQGKNLSSATMSATFGMLAGIGGMVQNQSAVSVAKMQTRDIAVRTQYNLINQFREQFNNSKIHPREMKLSVNGKIFYADKKLSEGAPIFSGLSNKQIEQLFKDISGINKLPKGKIVQGIKSINGEPGIVYPVKPEDSLLKDTTVNLRNFSTSQDISGVKWTIEIIKGKKNIESQGLFKSDKIEIKFK
ncbi:hypothetical protein A1D23_08465 [Chelonobacter oris]|uniref:hypothetical protein n=1 Tax=Chelonobacter oris TaxID=505317 RepID=UPI00244AB6AC|nr:hypothetical protein [Chelonobacter oris]MDH3000211.1 hypothetical protein [Chelonobacter oris]